MTSMRKSSEKTKPVPKLTGIADLNENDVFCGKYGPCGDHAGNSTYYRFIKLNKPIYSMSEKSERHNVCKAMVKAIRRQSPPGRFLERDQKSGLYNDIGDKRAADIISKALAETGQSDDGKLSLTKELPQIDISSAVNNSIPDLPASSDPDLPTSSDANANKNKRINSSHTSLESDSMKPKHSRSNELIDGTDFISKADDQDFPESMKNLESNDVYENPDVVASMWGSIDFESAFNTNSSHSQAVANGHIKPDDLKSSASFSCIPSLRSELHKSIPEIGDLEPNTESHCQDVSVNSGGKRTSQHAMLNECEREPRLKSMHGKSMKPSSRGNLDSALGLRSLSCPLLYSELRDFGVNSLCDKSNIEELSKFEDDHLDYRSTTANNLYDVTKGSFLDMPLMPMDDQQQKNEIDDLLQEASATNDEDNISITFAEAIESDFQIANVCEALDNSTSVMMVDSNGIETDNQINI